MANRWVMVPTAWRGKPCTFMRLLLSPENGKWYALAADDRTIAHGFDTAAKCAAAVEKEYATKPWEPRKHG